MWTMWIKGVLVDRHVDSLNAWRGRWLERRESQLSTKVIHSTTTRCFVKDRTPTAPSPPHPGVVTELIAIMRRLFELELLHDSPGPIRRAAIESVLKEVGR